jgi:hypothetical protein
VSELADDEDFHFYWRTRLSMDDKTVTLTMNLTESREFDFWTNRFVIEALRSLADEIEQSCEEHEVYKQVDH